MDASVWGPHSWFFLHSVTFGYPIEPTESDKKSYYNFITGLQYTLPCKECRKHFTKLLSDLPLYPYLDTRKNFVRWMVEVHNRVNISLKKKTYNVHDILNKYKEWYENKNFLKLPRWITLMIIICVIQLVIFMYLIITKRISISLK